MSTEITNYQCPACTAPLRFDGESGKLVCDYCGSSYEVSEIEALYVEKEKAAAEASEKEAGETPEGLRAYQCPTCGAELICEKTTAATSCPYCGNPTVIPGQLTGEFRPELVIPFKLDKEAAVAALKKHYRKNPFLPRVFSQENHIQQVQGVYVPFWLYDTTASGGGTYAASRSITTREGDYNVTRTMHYTVQREGSARFDRVPADGSKKMPDNYMDSLEPFDFSELKPFSTAYLPGFLADRYDVSREECGKRVNARCKETLEDLLRSDVIGYDMVTTQESHGQASFDKVSYALLPVWMLTTRWKDKNYLFAMNGQTGKFIGELPSSGALFWRAVGLMSLGLSLLLTLGFFLIG